LRDRLAVQLDPQLPMLVRGFYYQGSNAYKGRTRNGIRNILAIAQKLLKAMLPSDQKHRARGVQSIGTAPPGMARSPREWFAEALHELWPKRRKLSV